MSELKKNSSVGRLDSQKWGRCEGEKIFEFMFHTLPAGLVGDSATLPPPPKPPIFNKPFVFLEEVTDLLVPESPKH